jgi:hypothetical protein
MIDFRRSPWIFAGPSLNFQKLNWTFFYCTLYVKKKLKSIFKSIFGFPGSA